MHTTTPLMRRKSRTSFSHNLPQNMLILKYPIRNLQPQAHHTHPLIIFYMVIMQQMLEQCPTFTAVHNKANGKQIYDYLSRVLQQFTYFFQSAHKIMSLYLKDESYLQERLTLEVQTKIDSQNLLEDLQQLKKTNNQATPTVYRRFVCRMVEIILPAKQELISSHKNTVPLMHLIRQLEACVNSFQKNSNLENLIQNLLVSFNNFLKNIKNIDKCQFLPIKTKHELIPRPTENVAKVEKTKPENTPSTSREESTRRYRKFTDGLNLRYNTIACMQIDYQHFRSTYFSAKNTQQFYDECLQRNKNIKSNILSYSKEFKQYLIKKQARREKRKINFRTSTNGREKKQYKSVNISEKINMAPIVDKRLSIKVNNWAGDKSRVAVPTTRFNMETEKVEEDFMRPDLSQMRRTNYQMKNILMTASKLKIGPLQSPPQKNKQRSISKNSMEIGLRKNNWRHNLQQLKKNPNNKSFL